MEKDVMQVMKNVSSAFYQERIKDGISGLEEMIGMVFGLLGEDECIVRFLDAIEAGDYVLAADIIEFDMMGRIGEKA